MGALLTCRMALKSLPEGLIGISLPQIIATLCPAADPPGPTSLPLIMGLYVDGTGKSRFESPCLGKLADVKYEGKKALICLVGEDIRGQNGMAAQVFGAIRHINVRMISQGASEINMSFMIEEDDAEEAVRSLHAAFFKDPDPAIFDVDARKQ